MTTTVPALPSPPAPELRPAPRNHQRELMRTARQAVSAIRQFVKNNPSQLLTLHENGKKHVRIETWQLLAACFGCSALITSTQELRDKDENEVGYIAIAHTRNRESQIVSGAEATCLRSEPYWLDKPAFQLRSMAQTRGQGKTYRLQFGWVMVMAGFEATPAEEIEFSQSFDQIENASHATPKVPKVGRTTTERQVHAFEDACATHGRTARDVADYLKSEHGAEKIEELGRGKPFTVALEWANAGTPPRKQVSGEPQPVTRLLDFTPKHKDAFSL